MCRVRDRLKNTKTEPIFGSVFEVYIFDHSYLCLFWFFLSMPQ